ncbi:AmmeMemoRadiSam system protein B [Thermosipho atlanticus]|uniref:MEMO1 family protein SAMN02745199_1044 n=1 Tax=Thermosipho atlanticus DSM 15807 TaxID=1123380 RepID=A0A1M5STE2_9BACT|nr:AmmeMemoRadiSam system protein B [Thermosipho atlanticus]SHH41253.1 hypothetical protein SAMN02745199_1044 [Thermosipho atlanticus DSM 15807]
MVRKAIFSGKFYPEKEEDLIKFIKQHTNGNAEYSEGYFKRLGLILPHAGYIFSGKTAIKAVEKARNIGKPKTIVIFGTNHTGYGEGICSVWDHGYWETPLGEIEIDEDFASRLVDNSNLFKVDYTAHFYEHSIEVLLPILKYFFGDFRMVPVVYNFQSLENSIQIIEKLMSIYVEKVLFVASSDLNHFENDKVTREKDLLLIKQILNRDIEGIFEIVKLHNISACGIGPISILVGMFEKIQLIEHTTSAEATGDYSYTVGYASFLLR